MKWQNLDKKILKKLKKTNVTFLVASENNEFEFDIIKYLDLEGLGLPTKQLKYHWSSELHKNNSKYEYCNKDLLQLFKYFCVLINPCKSFLK